VNRFEALDTLYKVNKLIQEDQFGQAMIAIGMNDEAFPEGQSLEELLQAFQVRIADLMRVAGIK
jgi:hypothetical protein